MFLLLLLVFKILFVFYSFVSVSFFVFSILFRVTEYPFIVERRTMEKSRLVNHCNAPVDNTDK